MARTVSLVILCIGSSLASAGCDGGFACPPTGYNDGYQGGYDYGEALVQAQMQQGDTPNQRTYWLRHWNGDSDMAAVMSGNFSNIDWEAEYDPGCSDYQWAFQYGWTDGLTAGSQDAQNGLISQLSSGDW